MKPDPTVSINDMSNEVDNVNFLTVKSHTSKYLSLVRIVDCLVIFVSLWLGSLIIGDEWSIELSWIGVFSMFIYSFLAERAQVYDFIGGLSNSKVVCMIFLAWTGTALLVVGTLKLASMFGGSVSHDTLLINWSLTAPALISCIHVAGRHMIRFWKRHDVSKIQRVAIVGANPLGERLSKAFDSMPWLDYKVVGYYDDRKATQGGSRRVDVDSLYKGGLENLYIDAKKRSIDSVFITLPMCAEQRIKELINRLADSTISAYIIPDVYSFNLLHPRLTSIRGIPAVSIYDSPLKYHKLSKRILDIFFSVFFLTILAIPMLFIALGVKLSSKGPVFFKQNRYGAQGESIKVWKFRSMKVQENGGKVDQATKNDPRVTKFGAFIRKTSLDELPQFINVLLGSMSIVGPRPHAVAHNEFYREHIHGYMLRHKMKPGITGWAQINGFRGETKEMNQMEGRIKYDLEYIRNWSHWLDIKIIFLTFFKGFVGSNVY